ncbi:MAG TPA: Smr/MutS family protein [Burkholderiales bacterium]|jgi:DNA-nicking Smr family endonuclease
MRPPPDDEDFRKALAGVERLAEPRRRPLARPRPTPIPRQTRRDERAALAESLAGDLSVDDALDSGDELAYVREGYGRDLLRKLRRGHWVIQDALDLHGMNRLQAAEAVADFLRRCLRRRLRCVRIVHGKGLGSRNREPVLKQKLRKWLLREDVLAYCQAPAAEGGSGAALVLLKG